MADVLLVDLYDFHGHTYSALLSWQIKGDGLGVSYLKTVIAKGQPTPTNILYKNRFSLELYPYGFS